MSARQLAKLQKQMISEKAEVCGKIDEEDESEDDVSEKPSKTTFLMFESSSDEELDSSEDEDNGDDEIVANNDEESIKSREIANDGDDDDDNDEEDIDAILNEFAMNDAAGDFNNENDKKSLKLKEDEENYKKTANYHLLRDLETRDFDLDYVMRKMMVDGSVGGVAMMNADVPSAGNMSNNKTADMKKGKKPLLFASPNYFSDGNDTNNGEGNNNNNNNNRRQQQNMPKPPHFLGGGLGMNIIDHYKQPYYYDHYCYPPQGSVENHPGSNPYEKGKWYQFQYSDTYKTTDKHFNLSILNAFTSDANSLVLFVGQNSFYVPSLLKLSMIFYQTQGNANRGLEMLKRALYVLEHACVSGFLPVQGNFTKGVSPNQIVLMDVDQEENESLFSALFQLTQVSYMIGCVETSLITSRFLLSLDPIRDPMGVLLTLDYFALATRRDIHLDFLINLIESNTITIMNIDLDEETSLEVINSCDLVQMPNWSYSYALALYLREQQREIDGVDNSNNYDDGEEDGNDHLSDVQLQKALMLYPSVLLGLLEINQVDVKSHSFNSENDWPTILPEFKTYSNLKRSSSSTAVGKIIQIFIKRNHTLWKHDNIVTWLSRNCKAVVEKLQTEGDKKLSSLPPETAEAQEEEKESPQEKSIKNIHKAIDRYRTCDPNDYSDRFQTLGDMNFINEAFIGPALIWNPMRQGQQGRMANVNRRGGNNAAINRHHFQQHQAQQQQMLEMQRLMLAQQQEAEMGTVVLDPDSPLMELFWRSFLPWSRVQGVRHQAERRN